MEKITWKQAREKSGLKTSAIVKALGMSNSMTFYNREKNNSFSWQDASILCKLYGVRIEQIVI